jgi:hypothetical protein
LEIQEQKYIILITPSSTLALDQSGIIRGTLCLPASAWSW